MGERHRSDGGFAIYNLEKKLQEEDHTIILSNEDVLFLMEKIQKLKYDVTRQHFSISWRRTKEQQDKILSYKNKEI